MGLSVNESGTWSASLCFFNNGGTWTPFAGAWVNLSGTWTPFYSAVSITGGGPISSTAGSAVFTLGISSPAGTPSAYSWSTTGGTLSSTTGSSPNLTLVAGAGSTISVTVTCQVTIGGTIFTATTSCSYRNTNNP